MRPNPFPAAKSKVTPPTVDALIAAIAARQHGVITTAQLARAGIGYSGISKRAASGRLHRSYPGVYAVVLEKALAPHAAGSAGTNIDLEDRFLAHARKSGAGTARQHQGP